VDLSHPHYSYPSSPLWDCGCQLVRDAFDRAGTPLNAGLRLGNIFVRAGLPFPTLVSEGAIGGGRASGLYPWLATTVASVAPRLDGLGLALPPALVPFETLAERLEEEAIRLGSQVAASTQYAAWTRKPLHLS